MTSDCDTASSLTTSRDSDAGVDGAGVEGRDGKGGIEGEDAGMCWDILKEVFGTIGFGDEGGAGTKDAERRVRVTKVMEEVMDDVSVECVWEERLWEVRNRGRRRCVEVGVRDEGTEGGESVLGDRGGTEGGGCGVKRTC